MRSETLSPHGVFLAGIAGSREAESRWVLRGTASKEIIAMMHTAWIQISGSVALTLMSMSQVPAQVPPDSEKETLSKTAIIAYAANVKSFPFFQCRYSITSAQARSVSDAIHGKFINAITYDARLIVDGEKDLYEGLTPPVPPSEKGIPVSGKKGMYLVPAPINSDRYLSDGQREMNYCPQLRSLGLWSVEKGHHGIAHTPLGMHCVEHRNTRGPDVLMSQTDRYDVFSEGLGDLDGQPVVTVRFKDKKDKFVTAFSLDVAHGYLPRRVITCPDGEHPRLQVFVTDFRECSNQRWFPDRSLLVHVPDQGDLYSVRELKVLDLDADHRPAASEFTIAIPAGTAVVDGPGDTTMFFRLKQDEKLGTEDMARLSDMLVKVSTTPLMDTAVPHTSPFRWLRWAGAALGVGLAFCGVLFLVGRRFRRSAA
jgi:hypothetical protein